MGTLSTIVVPQPTCLKCLTHPDVAHDFSPGDFRAVERQEESSLPGGDRVRGGVPAFRFSIGVESASEPRKRPYNHMLEGRMRVQSGLSHHSSSWMTCRCISYLTRPWARWA